MNRKETQAIIDAYNFIKRNIPHMIELTPWGERNIKAMGAYARGDQVEYQSRTSAWTKFFHDEHPKWTVYSDYRPQPAKPCVGRMLCSDHVDPYVYAIQLTEEVRAALKAYGVKWEE